MKVLITGAGGFIGSHLTKILNNGFETYDLKDGNDILDKKNLINKMLNVDAVIHLAGKISVVESLKKPEYYYLHNVQGTMNVIDTAIKCGVKRIVFTSSACAVYPFTNPYGMSKWICEKMLEERQGEIQSIVLRIFNVYGVGNTLPNVINNFADSIRQKKEIVIYGDGKSTRDFVYVSDVCEAIKKATYLPDGESGFALHEVGFGRSISIIELAYLLMGLLGRTVPVKFKKGRDEVKHSKANPEFYKAKVDLVEGLGKIL